MKRSSAAILNALSFDVEAYFQVSGFEAVVNRDDWPQYDTRIHVGMDKILAVLARHQVKATFFFLGWIAERHPEAVIQVAEQGHEIGIHGYDHQMLYAHTPESFRCDLEQAMAAVRKVYDGPLRGYRAPSFSIRSETLWALDVLKDLGFTYDSSIFPISRKRYGMAGTPRGMHTVPQGLMEFPMSTIQLGPKTLPVAGGGYFRLYPAWFTHWAIEKINAEGLPANVYLHPWEFDPDQPKIQADPGNTFRHRVNLAQTEQKLDQLCQRFHFAPMYEVIERYGTLSATLNPPKSPEVINQSTPQYWDGMVADFDSIYSGESKSTLDVLLDRWLRKDIYDRVEATFNGIQALGPNQLVLDVGLWGPAASVFPWARPGTVLGVDFSPQMLEKAKANTTQAGVADQCQFFQADLLTSMPETVKQQAPYGAAAILGVLDYIEDPSPMFANLKDLGLKRVFASFPRAGTLRCELRKLRYKVQGLDCPLYFFTPEQVDQYGYQVMGAKKVTQQIMGELHFAVYEF